MASIISYLENYVEGTLGLPSDLSRFLNMIRVLDDRVADLSVAIKGTTEALCALEPVGGRKGTPAEQEYSSLIATFKRQEALLYQFSEEKVQLAQHALELIARYHKELDTTTAHFEDELASAPMAAPDAYNPFEAPYAAPGGKGSRSGKGYSDQWDSLEPLAAPGLKRHGGGSIMASGGGSGFKKRVRDDPRSLAMLGSGGDDYGGGLSGHAGGSNPGSMGVGGDQLSGYPPLTFMAHERTVGLLDSAQQPQLPGRLLQLADIRSDLQGRQAEMYWPDDNMWYLIEIHRVNVAEKTATIVYRTGEVEELNLSEIANEGHMSLIDL